MWEQVFTGWRQKPPVLDEKSKVFKSDLNSFRIQVLYLSQTWGNVLVRPLNVCMQQLGYNKCCALSSRWFLYLLWMFNPDVETCPRSVLLSSLLLLLFSLSSGAIFTSWLQNRMWSAEVLPGVRRLRHCSLRQCKGRPALVNVFSASPDPLCSASFQVKVK